MTPGENLVWKQPCHKFLRMSKLLANWREIAPYHNHDLIMIDNSSFSQRLVMTRTWWQKHRHSATYSSRTRIQCDRQAATAALVDKIRELVHKSTTSLGELTQGGMTLHTPGTR